MKQEIWRNGQLIETVILTETTEEYVTRIKNKAGNIILFKYPQWKQANMTARYTELLTKQLDQTITNDELNEMIALRNVWDQIKAVREYSNYIEQHPEEEENWPIL